MTTDRHYLTHYWQYLKKQKRLLGIGFLFIPLISLFHILQPYLIKLAIDDHIVHGDIRGLLMMTLFFGLCVGLDFTCKTLQTYIFQYIGQKTVTEIRHDLFLHVLTLSSSYYDKTPVGVVTSRLTSDIESLNESFSSGLVTLLADLLTLIGIMIMMFILSPRLTLITFLMVPFIILMVNFFKRKLRYYFKQIISTIGELHGYIQEQLSGIAVVQLFHQQRHSLMQFETFNRHYRQSTIRSVSYDALLYSLIDSINILVITLIIWYGWGQYHEEMVTIGLLVAFIDYIHKFFMPIKEISNKFAILQHALAALEKIFGLFDVKQIILSGNRHLESITGTVEFNRVSFHYPDHEEDPVLHDISFTIRANQVVAIVGSTGSGKTTILRLISRLYQGHSGSILLDGCPIEDISYETIRRGVSMVNQDATLFSASISFNISMGDPTITHDRIVWAAKQVQIHDFICRLPNGYDTFLDCGTQSLSVGQAQLICFARALANMSPIILLDEATASVDSFTESKIQIALNILFQQKTVIVVAHRLSTIKFADHILALSQGKIIECGTHEELLQYNGFYANLYNMQFSKDEEPI